MYDSSDDTPTEVDEDGTMRWLNEDYDLHHVGKPAVVRPNGAQEWWENGEMIRAEGPPDANDNRTVRWWIDAHCSRDGQRP